MKFVFRHALVAAMFGCLIAATAAHAGIHTSRTYFGKPGAGPYRTAPRYRHPRTIKILGIRCCKTPKQRYEEFLDDYAIVQDIHYRELDRVAKRFQVRYIEGFQCHPECGCR